MRTDVKVGLISGILILGGIFAYSAFHGSRAASPRGLETKEVSAGFGPAQARANVVIPAPATAPATTADTSAPGTTRPSGWPAPSGGDMAPSDPFSTGVHTTATRPATSIWDTPPTTTIPPTTHTPPRTGTDTFGSSDFGTPPTTSAGGTYIIKSGDTLGALAKSNHVTLKALQDANPTADSNHLKIGQKITIPAASSTPTTTGTGTGTGTSGAATIPAAGTTYKVKAGDTLSKIAKAVYGNAASYTKILRANKDRITNEDQIKEGMILKIPH